ncbi:MAG: AMP-binding protein [Gammaproteobacteria bacterium]|nr:AMP-binding protein [Gammaproteobacteria bacterium]
MKKNFCSIIAIFTDDIEIQHWAENNNYKVYCINDINIIKKFNIDYLISIYNPKILSASIIAHANEHSINYHNALLPKYRGSNATAWAIYNHEKEHGITWHIMTENLDQGDILFQKKIMIDGHDTASSLNIRCDDLARKTLNEFIDKLLSGKCKNIKSHSGERIYYLIDQPKNKGFIDWKQSAKKIYEEFRSLSFKNYDNSIATPKFVYNKDIFIIERMRITNTISPKDSAGKILKVTRYIEIGTLTNIIRINEIRDFYGNTLSIKKIFNNMPIKHSLHLKENNQWLDAMKAILGRNLSEKFWKHEWKKFSGESIGFFDLYKSNNGRISKKILNIKKHNIFYRKKYDNCSLLVSSILVFLYRHNQYREVSLLLEYKFLDNYIHNFFPKLHTERNRAINPMMYRKYIPFSTKLYPDDTLDDIQDRVINTMKKLHEMGPYLKDFFHRYQTLNKPEFPLIIIKQFSSPNHIDSDKEGFDKNSALTFSISRFFSKVLIQTHISPEVCKENYANLISNHLMTMWSAYLSKESVTTKDLSLIPSYEREKYLIKWSGKNNFNIYKKNMLNYFDDIALKEPNKIAIVDNDRCISYALLKEESNRVASFLSINGINCRSGVFLFSDGNSDAIIAILGILRIRSFYVPISSLHPDNIIISIFKESDSRIILVTNKRMKIKLKELLNKNSFTNYKIYNVQDIASKNVINKYFNISRYNHNDTAYIMYTSGSTGKPKGVVITQKGIIRLVKDTNYITISGNDRIIHTSDIAFDASTFLIWGTLLNGATLYFSNKNNIINPDTFNEELRKNKITILWLTSRLFDFYIDIKPEIFKLINIVLVGGEMLDKKHVKKILYSKKQNNHPLLIHVYGPTENTIE